MDVKQVSSVQEKLTQLTLDVSEVVFVRRLSPLASQEFVDRAKTLYPPPNPKDYERPLKEIAPNAIEGMMMSAEQNPNYAADVTRAKSKQNDCVLNLVLRAGVVIDTLEGRELTIARYAERLDYLRNIPLTMPEDEWLATVLYGLITTPNDRNRIVSAAMGTLSGEEISTAMRMFRQKVQWQELNLDH